MVHSGQRGRFERLQRQSLPVPAPRMVLEQVLQTDSSIEPISCGQADGLLTSTTLIPSNGPGIAAALALSHSGSSSWLLYPESRV